MEEFQRNVFYPLPAVTAVALCVFWALLYVARRREFEGKKHTALYQQCVVFFLWLSFVLGFAGSMALFTSVKTLICATVAFDTQVRVAKNDTSLGLVFSGCAVHAFYVLAVWYTGFEKKANTGNQEASTGMEEGRVMVTRGNWPGVKRRPVNGNQSPVSPMTTE